MQNQKLFPKTCCILLKHDLHGFFDFIHKIMLIFWQVLSWQRSLKTILPVTLWSQIHCYVIIPRSSHQLCDCGDMHLNRVWWACWHPATLKGATTLTSDTSAPRGTDTLVLHTRMHARIHTYMHSLTRTVCTLYWTCSLMLTTQVWMVTVHVHNWEHAQTWVHRSANSPIFRQTDQRLLRE